MKITGHAFIEADLYAHFPSFVSLELGEMEHYPVRP